MNWIIVLLVVVSEALLIGVLILERRQRKIMDQYIAELKQRSPIASAPPLPPHDAVELLSMTKGEWAHHSFRPAGHRDIEEALATPGLAIRQDGVITEGVQDAV